MAKVKLTKNLLKDRDEYTRYFGAFSGVDFSSDHTEVRDDRFAYLKNMYKDYQSGQGEAIETIPGFRRLFTANEPLNGIHVFQRYKNGGLEKKVILHIGDTLWEYDSNFESGECLIKKKSEYEKDFEGWETIPEFPLIEDSASMSVLSGGKMYLFDGTRVIAYDGTAKISSCYIPTTYINAVTLGSTLLMYEGTMGPVRQRTNYRIFAGRDGASIGVEHEQRNLMTPWYKMSFVAQDYEDTNCFQLNTKAYQKEKTPYDETNYNNESEKDNDDYSPGYPKYFKVYQYGTQLPWAFYSSDESTRENDPYLIPDGYPNAIVGISEDGVVELVNAPPAPEKNRWDPVNRRKTLMDNDTSFAYPSGYAGIEISVYKPFEKVAGKYVKGNESIAPLARCTLSAVHDNRIFLSGHPEYPNAVFYCNVDDDTYFGELNTVQIGVGSSPVTSLLPVANTLMVLKRDTVQDGAVSFLTGQDTDDNIIPRIYAVTPGLPGLGGLGPCCNFFDDPIFISKLGVEAMGQLSVRYERAVEHRSSLIDAALLGCDLEKASIVEWGGYMLILIEGRIFMADYRQRFSHSSGVTQYEWYYLEDIGVYHDQYERYVYSRFPHVALSGTKIEEMDLEEEEKSLIGETANPPKADGTEPDTVQSYTDDNGNVIHYVEREGKAVFCELSGAVDGVDFYPEYIGGEFDPAAKLFTVGEDLYFATASGVVCKFNFDKRDPETRTIPNRWYTFDDRAIESGAAIKMDNCGIPHLTKDTVKRSTIFKTRSSDKSTAKIYVRTNKSPYKQIDRLIGGTASFEAADFIDITFGSADDDKTLFSVRERERGWVEKQYFIKSDEFMRPFALYYIVYCYHVAGRYKE